MTDIPLLYDIAKIKREAVQSIDAGAVTKDYPLDVNQACQLLNSALSTEIMCVLRYRHHQIVAHGIHHVQVAAEFEEHAIEEEKHMMLLAERINQLGGEPDFNPASVITKATTEYSSKTDLVSMIKEDLIAERIAISIYRSLIQWFGANDPTTRNMLEGILKDEEEHASDLVDLLNFSDK
jgi:bacterioferritin